MHWGYGMGGWMMFFWILLALVIFAVAVWAAIRVAGGSRGGSAPPEEILRERYARGEITREQFEQMRDDLRR